MIKSARSFFFRYENATTEKSHFFTTSTKITFFFLVTKKRAFCAFVRDNPYRRAILYTLLSFFLFSSTAMVEMHHVFCFCFLGLPHLNPEHKKLTNEKNLKNKGNPMNPMKNSTGPRCTQRTTFQDKKHVICYFDEIG